MHIEMRVYLLLLREAYLSRCWYANMFHLTTSSSLVNMWNFHHTRKMRSLLKLCCLWEKRRIVLVALMFQKKHKTWSNEFKCELKLYQNFKERLSAVSYEAKKLVSYIPESTRLYHGAFIWSMRCKTNIHNRQAKLLRRYHHSVQY